MADVRLDIQAIFNQAIELDSDDERQEFLDQACENEAAARQRVEALLRAHSEAGDFFRGGTRDAGGTIDHPAANRVGTQIGPYKLREQIGADEGRSDGNEAGEAHLFDVTTGELLRTFDDPTPTDRDGFGSSVALDGNHVLIGALGDDTNGGQVGQAHLFDAVAGNLLHTFVTADFDELRNRFRWSFP